MEYTKPQTYSFKIEPFNNQLALYYWQYGSGTMKAYIYRPLNTSHLQMALDFVATYPQYQIDFTFHNFLSYVGNSIYMMEDIYNFTYDDIHPFIYPNLDTTIFKSISLTEFNNKNVDFTFGNLLKSRNYDFYKTVGNTNDHVIVNVYFYDNCVVYYIDRSINSVGNDFDYPQGIFYSTSKKTTNCCITACCNPNDYVLI